MTSSSRVTLRLLAGRTVRRLAVPGFLLVVFATLAGVIPGIAAQAAQAGDNAGTFKNAVTFIGDSVTAGFGFCGVAENASGVQCQVNQQMANSWDYEYNSLDDCAPPSPPAALNDACSNDNNDGSPWDSPPWTSGPGAPDVAYPYQIAASQAPAGAASVSDWAVSGSTPANWDTGGAYHSELRKLTGQYVVMTLGGNPLLGDFLEISLGGVPVQDGSCVSSTGYSRGYFYPTWYAGPVSNATGCLTRTWNQLDQTRHLASVYETLLAQGDRVLVLGYYRSCPWSFGNWQSGSLLDGPAAGESCSSQSRPTSPRDPATVTQWQQALAVGNTLNSLVDGAVTQARAWARTRWPGTARYLDLAWARPDESQWALHQPLSPGGSWIQLNDTWIHPDPAGAAQLAGTVTAAMCADFQHWCGSPPAWG